MFDILIILTRDMGLFTLKLSCVTEGSSYFDFSASPLICLHVCKLIVTEGWITEIPDKFNWRTSQIWWIEGVLVYVYIIFV